MGRELRDNQALRLTDRTACAQFPRNDAADGWLVRRRAALAAVLGLVWLRIRTRTLHGRVQAGSSSGWLCAGGTGRGPFSRSSSVPRRTLAGFSCEVEHAQGPRSGSMKRRAILSGGNFV